MSRTAIILGYSGHAYVLLDILIGNGFEIAGYCDKKQNNSNPYNLQFLGDEEDDFLTNTLLNSDVFLGVGDNKTRAQIFKRMQMKGIDTPSLIHRSTSLSPQSKIGPGSVVMPGAIINAMASIGDAVICNSGCVIEHECVIEDFSHIAPGAVLAGNVLVGYNTLIGANAVIKPGITIGSNVIIGAGAVVTQNIPDGITVYGNPAKQRRNG